MDSAAQVQTTRRVYRVKLWQRVSYILLGLLFAGTAALLGFLAIQSETSNQAVQLIMVPLFLAAGLYTAAWALRSRLTLDGSRIEVRGAFGERTAERSEIEGIRTVQSRNGSYQQLILKDGRKPITISNGFNTDDDFRAWMQPIPDLDARDRQAVLDEISKDQELGATPEERLRALARARQQSIALLVIATAAALGLNLAPAPFARSCVLALLLAPLIAAVLCWKSPLLFTALKKKSDPRAETSYSLMVAGFGLLFRAGNFHYVSLHAALADIALLSLAMALAYYAPASKSSNRAAFVALLFFALLYGYGGVTAVNAVFDNSPGQVYSAQVVSRHISHGRSTTYYLRLAPWGPVTAEKDVSVPSRIYDASPIGVTMCPELHRGALSLPWFRVTQCFSGTLPITVP